MRALRGLAVTTLGHESFAFFEAAHRHIGDEARVRIAALHSGRVLREGDDAIAQRLGATSRRGRRMRPPLTRSSARSALPSTLYQGAGFIAA